MKIAIIGAGYTGLSAAHQLSKSGHTVDVFEAETVPGGLAAGFQEKEWEWSVEKHYHHLFRSDKDFQELLAETNLSEKLQYYSVKTSTLYKGDVFQLDSPLSLLQCSALSFSSRLRTGATLAGLKFMPWHKKLDEITAKEFILKTMGKEVWEVLWEPLFIGKFGGYADKINASWFWARIHVRSQQLGYLSGGFGMIAQDLVKFLKSQKVSVHFSSPVEKIMKQDEKWKVKIKNKKELSSYDQVLVTGPHTLLHALVPELDRSYTQSLNGLKSLGAMTLILELGSPFFSDQTYWLNINEKGWPFLAVVEHTNMVASSHYDGKHLLYIGKYLKPDEKQFSLTKDELLKLYTPYLSKISPNFSSHIRRSWLFKERYAQPIAEVNHHKNIPSIKTPLDGLFWASMHHVYPWDRGTNYAIRLGKEATRLMQSS